MGVHIYRVWVKTDEEDYKTWHTSDLINLQIFLDSKYPQWRFFNVYDKKTGNNLASFTKSKRALSKKV